MQPCDIVVCVLYRVPLIKGNLPPLAKHCVCTVYHRHSKIGRVSKEPFAYDVVFLKIQNIPTLIN
jgi:hypothetical protein